MRTYFQYCVTLNFIISCIVMFLLQKPRCYSCIKATQTNVFVEILFLNKIIFEIVFVYQQIMFFFTETTVLFLYPGYINYKLPEPGIAMLYTNPNPPKNLKYADTLPINNTYNNTPMNNTYTPMNNTMIHPNSTYPPPSGHAAFGGGYPVNYLPGMHYGGNGFANSPMADSGYSPMEISTTPEYSHSPVATVTS